MHPDFPVLADTNNRRRRRRRFEIAAALVVVVINGILVYRISCLPGGAEGGVTWHWGLGGRDVVGTCEGTVLLQYLVIDQWPLTASIVLAATVAWIWWRRRGRRRDT